MSKSAIFMQKNLVISKISSTFAVRNDERLVFAPTNRDLAQLVEYTSGGREVAGSSPVIPT